MGVRTGGERNPSENVSATDESSGTDDGRRVAEPSPLTLRALGTALSPLSPAAFSSLTSVLLPLPRPRSPSCPRGRPPRRRPHAHELSFLPLPPVRCLGFSPYATEHSLYGVSVVLARWSASDTAQAFGIDQVLSGPTAIIVLRMVAEAVVFVARRGQPEHLLSRIFSPRACHIAEEAVTTAISSTLRLLNRRRRPSQGPRFVARFPSLRLRAHHSPALARSPGCRTLSHEVPDPRAHIGRSRRRCGR